MITLGDGASSLCEPLTRSPLGPLSLEKDWIIAAHPKLANSQPGHASDELCAQNATQQVLKVLISLKVRPTCFECFDGNRCCVVPQPLPHLPELAVAELPDELEAGPVNQKEYYITIT